ncbi:hypothetical protein FQA39_LY09442 [Lamprigera yunnana]|nr:hypothetical protein FQA39_LY09442 [Lamprigera yunnana]
MLKAVILIGGPQKGTRFRPLSLDIPKPLFPVAGLPLIQHHIEACITVEGLKEVLLVGYYPASQIQQFVTDMQQQYNIIIRYLQEFIALGTAGGLYHFRDQIRCGNPNAFFLMNGDVCADFPLQELYLFHKAKGNRALVTIMGTEATRQQSLNYGCIVTNKMTQEVTHYVEKPSSYVSTLINCGVYVFSLDIFHTIGEVFNTKQQDLYRFDLFPYLKRIKVNNWWSQLKTAGSAIYANRHYLELYRAKHPERLCQKDENGKKCNILPDVYIHPSATVHPTAMIGPNVTIGPGVTVGPGARIRESIILADAVIENHSLVLHSIVGHNSRVGCWTRVEGTPSDPDPNKPFAKMENPPLFNHDVDSIPTSCIQLAKEQIIKYSDPKYNINDLKTGDCETMLLNQTIYYLNKSKSKWISVGLYYPFEFASVVKIFGRSKQYVIFKEEEWIQFHEQRENINKYFQTFDTMWKPRQIGSKTLTFEMIEEKKILKIEDMSGNEVYLGWESVSEVWSLESVLRYRLSYSSGSNFKYFYEDVIRAVAEMSGDVKINIYNIINRLFEKSDDVCCMLEVLLFMPEKALFDVQLERRIQEQGQKQVKNSRGTILLKKMWMLYAQEHWTKSYDLKSAVERLYEELGALEFDADHEAIYGMERYYTVQQCEELRDKYKIGRKVCRKFLQGKTCSQCLVKRISEIGLRHFLDTVKQIYKKTVVIHHHHPTRRYLKQLNKMVKRRLKKKKNKKKAKVEALLNLFNNLLKDSLNHSLKLNTIFSSNFCRELSDRFSKGIEI